MTEEKKKKFFFKFLWITYIVGFVIVFLYGALIPNFRKDVGASPRQRSCQSNIRVLMGAVEIYNMDTDKIVTKMDESVASSLKAKNYLKAIPRCPETNTFNYYSKGDISKKGVILCHRHGGLPGKQEEYEKKRDKIINSIRDCCDRALEGLPYAIGWPLLLIWFFIDFLFSFRIVIL